MFALREIIPDQLFAISLPEGGDAFHQCFERWKDVGHLHEFFTRHPEALSYYQTDRRTAVQAVLQESKTFFSDILAIAKGQRGDKALDYYIFQPLHESGDFEQHFLQTKAYGRDRPPSYLRLYAVRLSDGCYIVAGGLIKTGQAMQDCEEGPQILKTLKDLAFFLELKKHKDAFDIGVLIVEEP